MKMVLRASRTGGSAVVSRLRSSESESHLYAADLDIFGKGSLFELLCTARMRGGEETLADWLAGPTNREEIIARQDAVRELRNNIDLREDLTILGGELRSSIHPGVIIDWGNSPVIVESYWIRLALIVPVVFTLYTLWPIFTTLSAHPLWWLALGIEAAIGLMYRARVRKVIEGLSHPDRELKLLSLILARIEQERFKCAKLTALRRALETDGVAASQQIKRFTRLMNTLNWYRNEFFTPFSWILLMENTIHLCRGKVEARLWAFDRTLDTCRGRDRGPLCAGRFCLRTPIGSFSGNCRKRHHV